MALRIVTASANVPRDNHWVIPSGSTTSTRTLLLEHSRKESAYSNDFSNAVYTKENVTLTASIAGITAPDGTETAWFMRETTGNGNHGLVKETSGSSNAFFGFGVFVKPVNVYDVRLYIFGDSGTAGFITFNLNDTGSYTITNNSSTIAAGLMEDYGNGWWRLSALWRTPSLGTPQTYLRLMSGSSVSYTGNTNNGIYVWGWNTQDADPLSSKAAPVSSYISSSNVTASRADDILFFPSASKQPQECTIYVRGTSIGAQVSGQSAIIRLGEYGLSHAMLGIRANSNQIVGYFDAEGGSAAVTSATSDTTLLYPNNALELLLQFSGSKQVQLFHTKNGGDIITSSISSVSAGGFPSVWGSSVTYGQHIYLASADVGASTPQLSFAYRNVLVAQGKKTMQEMRSLAGAD